jgi:hypothetical protein
MIKLAEILNEYKINSPAVFKYDPELFYWYPSMSKANSIEDMLKTWGYDDKEKFIDDQGINEEQFNKMEQVIKNFHHKFAAYLYDGQDEASDIGNVDMDIRKYSKLIIKEDDNILLLILY